MAKLFTHIRRVVCVVYVRPIVTVRHLVGVRHQIDGGAGTAHRDREGLLGREA